MKKKYLLIIIMFLLSGCSVEYNLEFNSGELIEKIKIGKIDSNLESEISYFTPYSIYNDKVQELYNVNYSNQFLNLEYIYLVNDFETSEPFNKCYDLSNISYDNDYYYILTSNEFKCLTYADYTTDEVKIKFTTNHKVIETNADYVDNDIYIWNINKNNYKNKPIKIQVFRDVNETDKKETKNNDYIAYIVLGIILIFIVLIFLKIKRRVNINKL